MAALRIRPSIRPAAVLMGSDEGLSCDPVGRLVGGGAATAKNSENTAFKLMLPRVSAASSRRSRRVSRVALTAGSSA